MNATERQQSKYGTPAVIFWLSNILRVIGIVAMIRISVVALREIRAGVDTEFGSVEAVFYLVLAVLLGVFATTDVVMMYRRNTRLAKNLRKSVSKQLEVVSKADAELLTNRREIAMWVHGAAQSTVIKARTALATSCDNMMQKLNNDDPDALLRIAPEFNRTKEAMDGILTELLNSFRTRARELWPEHRELPLFPALQKILGTDAQLTVSPELRWTPDTRSTDRLDQPTSVQEIGTSKLLLAIDSRYEIVRVVEEAVNNARKYGATRIDASILLVGNRIHVDIKNNGAPLDGAVRPSLGLAIIEEIVHRRNGTFTLRNLDDYVVFTAEFEVEFVNLATVIRRLYDLPERESTTQASEK